MKYSQQNLGTKMDKSKPLAKETVMKIFGHYYGVECDYRKVGTKNWNSGVVNPQTFIGLITRNTECRIILKNIDQLEEKEAVFIATTFFGKDKATINELSIASYYSEKIKKQIEAGTLSYLVADYLRKKKYHVPIYGLDLFRARIAIGVNKMPDADIEEVMQKKDDSKKKLFLPIGIKQKIKGLFNKLF